MVTVRIRVIGEEDARHLGAAARARRGRPELKLPGYREALRERSLEAS